MKVSLLVCAALAIVAVSGGKNCEKLDQKFKRCLSKGYSGSKCPGDAADKELKRKLAKKCKKVERKYSKFCDCEPVPADTGKKLHISQ